MELRRFSPYVYSGQRIAMGKAGQLRGLFERVCYRLLLPLDGTLHVRRNDQTTRPVRPGQVRMLEPGEVVSWRGAMHCTRIAFDLFYRRRKRVGGVVQPASDRPQPDMGTAFDRPFDGVFPEPLHALAVDTVHRLAFMAPKRPDAVLAAQAGLCQLVSALLSYWRLPEADDLGPDRQFFHKVELVLQSQSSQGVTIAAVAKQLGMSAEHLCRRYRAERGCGPKRFLMNYRVQKAQELLVHGTAGIADIARQVGFGHASSMRQAFRSLVGMSPQQWREAQS